MTFPRNRLVSLLTAFAVALQAFWPLLAQARPAGETISVPICSIEHGAQTLELRIEKGQKSDKGSEHCKLCVLGLDAFVFSFGKIFLSCEEKQRLHLEPSSSASLSFLPAQPRAPPASA